jgi:hypothetical protein
MPYHITFSPVRAEEPITASLSGPVLTVNGIDYDLTAPDSCPWLLAAGLSGVSWHMTLLLPHGGDAPEETRFAGPVTLKEGGAIPLPPYDAPQPAPEEEADEDS